MKQILHFNKKIAELVIEGEISQKNYNEMLINLYNTKMR